MMRKPATDALPYEPPGDSVRPALPAGLKYGVRRIFVTEPDGELQYVVFAEGFDAGRDPKCHHVVGSGFTIEQAMHSACLCFAMRQRKPDFYKPRLLGCRFVTKVEDGNIALQHVAVDAADGELGRADTREAAARNALHRALVGQSDVTYEEFCEIAVPAQVVPSRTEGREAVFVDGHEQDRAAALVARMYRACPEVREGAAATAKSCGLVSQPPLRALQHSVYRNALSAVDGVDMASVRLSAEDGAWEAYLVLHSPAVSAELAMRQAYRGYVSERASETGESARPVA